MRSIKKSELHVHLGKVKHRRRFICLTSNNSFFGNKELLYTVLFDKIIFKIPSMEDKKRIIRTHENKNQKGSFRFSFVSDFDIESGDYLIDEDSMNEDEITIYLND